MRVTGLVALVALVALVRCDIDSGGCERTGDDVSPRAVLPAPR